MAHINYRRKSKIRKPILQKPNKVIPPDSLYDRNKEKKYWTRDWFMKEEDLI